MVRATSTARLTGATGEVAAREIPARERAVGESPAGELSGGVRAGSTPADDLVALPVAIRAPRHLVDQVGAWVEAQLGWQVTTGHALPPRLLLVAVGADVVDEPKVGDGVGTGRLPTIALVGADDDPVAATRLAAVADAVVAWPGEHDRLAGIANALLDSHPVHEAEVLRIGGAAGGVGTTTVALGVAAGIARRGQSCLAVVHGDVPVPDVRVVAPEVLAGHRAWPAAVEAPHVPGLRVVAAAMPPERVGTPARVSVVVDRGVDDEVDVLVTRRTRAGIAAIERSPAAVVVLVDTGPRPHRELVTATAGRPRIDLPWSARVARAHDSRRVPADLPHRMAAPLATLTEPSLPKEAG